MNTSQFSEQVKRLNISPKEWMLFGLGFIMGVFWQMVLFIVGIILVAYFGYKYYQEKKATSQKVST